MFGVPNTPSEDKHQSLRRCKACSILCLGLRRFLLGRLQTHLTTYCTLTTHTLYLTTHFPITLVHSSKPSPSTPYLNACSHHHSLTLQLSLSHTMDSRMGSVVMLVVVVVGLVGVSEGQLVPAVFIFGDSVVDAGNNNNLVTLVKANFPPYGRDFEPQHSPTGRFCNGKLATDLTVENLGFTSYPPAYLSQQATGKNLLIGANFASASSGYLDRTANLYRAITLTQQLNYYKEYQSKLESLAGGRAKLSAIVSGSIHILSAGSSDYVQNYYINPLINRVYTPDQFSDLLVQSFTSFVQNLYALGGRRIGATSLPPLGCLPAAITLFGGGSNNCVARLNNDATAFNRKLTAAGESLKKRNAGLKLVVFDIYNPLLDLIKHPANNGFFEARRACCGTGTIETSLLCNAGSPGTCANATGYVFWDSFHPSEAANKVLADALLVQGIDLIS